MEPLDQADAVMHIASQRIDMVPARRHDHRVRTVSTDYQRLRMLDHLVVAYEDATAIVAFVCRWANVPMPKLKYHSRRSPFTGITERPRNRVIDDARTREIPIPREVEALAPDGAIRLGRKVTLMTLSHELGHHIVHHCDPLDTPAHGNLWVHRFDQAAAVVDELRRA